MPTNLHSKTASPCERRVLILTRGTQDMYVDFSSAQETAAQVGAIQSWITNEYRHSGVRDDGEKIVETLLGMTRGTNLTFM